MPNSNPLRSFGSSTRRLSLIRGLSPETTHGLVTLLLLAFTGIVTLSLLNLGGPAGAFCQQAVRLLFGRGQWFAPIYLVVIVTLRLRPIERQGLAIVGMTLWMVASLGVLDLIPRAGQVVLGEGGGYLGAFLHYPLETAFGYPATWLLTVVIFLAALLITFDITLATLITPLLAVFSLVWQNIKDFFSGLRFRSPSDPYSVRAPLSISQPMFTMRRSELPSENNDDEVEQSALAGATPEIKAKSKTVSKYKSIPVDLPLSLLSIGTSKPQGGDIRENKMIIEKTLESFGIHAEMGEVSVGPTVAQYTLKPEDGIKLSAITGLANNLALALAAHSIRIEAPIPGKALVGIEVPNQTVATVHLREILESDAFQKRRSNLFMALGKDVAGQPWVVDLERLPHILVAGATGSGKSVCLNTIILSLLYQNSPSDLKIILVDPKRVEFQVYQHIPHLLTPVITEVPATVNALKWLLKEMDRRFLLLSSTGDRNIQTYNQRAEEKLPYIVVIIDELADLMVAAASEVEASIIRLAQMARAVGIHLILATQRPSVDVITGLIKANITTRVAFSVASLMDSRTILDTGGAEKLIGRGDMLYVSSEVPKPKRIQGCFVNDDELRSVMNYLKKQAAPEYISEVTERQSGSSGSSWNDDDDDLLSEAETVVLQAGKASASFLQRRLRVGYARAARLLDLLEARGVIGPGDGAKPRDVLLRPEDRDMLPTSSSSDNEDEEVVEVQEEAVEESDIFEEKEREAGEEERI